MMTTHTRPRPLSRPRSLAEQWRGAIAFEWTKLVGVRSTWWSLVLAVLATAGGGVLLGASARASGENGFDTAVPAPHLAFQSMQLIQLAIIVVAALFITAEYSSGSIGTTLQSVPVRPRVLLSKALVLATTVFVAGVVLGVVGSVAAALFAGDYGTFTGQQLVDTALATGAYLAAVSVLVLGLGTVLRGSAGTITVTLAVLFALPQLLPIFRIGWLADLADHLPSNAGLVLGLQLDEPYGATTAALVLVGWALAGIAAGAVLLQRRDA